MLQRSPVSLSSARYSCAQYWLPRSECSIKSRGRPRRISAIRRTIAAEIFSRSSSASHHLAYGELSSAIEDETRYRSLDSDDRHQIVLHIDRDTSRYRTAGCCEF